MNTHLFRTAAATFVLLAVSLQTSRSNAQAFTKGSTTVTGGYGLGSFLGSLRHDLNANTIMSQSSLGPYYLKVDKGITNHLSFGLSSSLMRNQFTVQPGLATTGGSDAVNATKVQLERWAYSAVGRLNYHFAKSKKFDPYFGAGIGYRSANWSVDNPDYKDLTRVIPNTPIAFEFGIGARYYILPGLGVYGEFGGSKSLLQGGLIYTLPGHNEQTIGGRFKPTKHGKPSSGTTGKKQQGSMKSRL